MHIYHGTNKAELSWARPIFRQRMSDGTATKGPHNYAMDISTKVIARSNSSAHAEISLIAMGAYRDQGITLASEYKPCSRCRDLFEEVERTRGIDVQVVYFLDYEDKGDGNSTITRGFYKKYGFLAGGGDYVYEVAEEKYWQLGVDVV